MMTLDYHAVCDELIAMGHIDSTMLWTTEQAESKFESDYTSELFRYAQDALTKKYPEFDIDPARFCFVNDEALDAEAKYYDGYYSILLNIGAVRHLYYLFDHEFADADDLLLQEAVSGLEPSISLFLMKFSLIFLFEHERAHLSQFSRQRKIDKSNHLKRHRCFYGFDKRTYKNHEATGKDGKFKLKKHLREMDADLNGVSYAGSHLLLILQTSFNQIPYEYFHELYAAAVASIMVLLHYWFGEDGSRPIYLKKKDHPHPIVRTCYCWDFFFQLLNNNPENITFRPNIDRIRRRAIELQNKIIELNGHNNYHIYSIKKRQKKVNKYIDFLSDKLDTAAETLQYAHRKN
jgi:hypothetical protein